MKLTSALNNIGRIVAAWAISVTLVHGGRIDEFAARADVIIVGTVTTRIESPTNVSFDINVERVLKGDLAVQKVHVSHQWVRAGGVIFDPTPTQVDQRIRAIWCLQRTGSSDWEVLPVGGGPKSFVGGLFWPVSATLGPDYQYPTGTALYDTLTFEIAAGREMDGHPEEMLGATGSVNTPALQTVFGHLLNHQKPTFQAIGLAGMLMGSQPGTIAQLTRLWPSLKVEPNRHYVLSALRDSFRDSTPGSVQQLAQLAGVSTTSAELRRAAVWALAAIHTKEALPFLASLLLSSDPDEQARGVVGLSSFANGCPSQTPDNVKSMEYLQFKNPSPYRNADTMANFAIGGINIPPGDTHLAQLVSFWISWWKQHPELH